MLSPSGTRVGRVQKVSRSPQQLGKLCWAGPHWRPHLPQSIERSSKGGNGLSGGRHLGCGRSRGAFASDFRNGGPSRHASLHGLASPARQFPPISLGPRARVAGEDPAWWSLRGLSELPLGRLLSLLPSGAHAGERQQVSEICTGWGKSVGALTDVFAVVARLLIGAEATPRLCGSGWRRPSGRRHPSRLGFGRRQEAMEFGYRWSCSEVHTIAEIDGRHVARVSSGE
jgi:hypothetical protein